MRASSSVRISSDVSAIMVGARVRRKASNNEIRKSRAKTPQSLRHRVARRYDEPSSFPIQREAQEEGKKKNRMKRERETEGQIFTFSSKG